MSVTDTAELGSSMGIPAHTEKSKSNPYAGLYMGYLKHDVRLLHILDEGKQRFRKPSDEAQNRFLSEVVHACEDNLYLAELLPGPYVIEKARAINKNPEYESLLEQAEIASADARMRLLKTAIMDDRSRQRVNSKIRAALQLAVQYLDSETAIDPALHENETVKRMLESHGIPSDIEQHDITDAPRTRQEQKRELQNFFDAIGVHDPTTEDPRKVINSNDTIFYMRAN